MEHNATEYFNGEWVREATQIEQRMLMCHKHGCLQVYHQLHLKCKVPLQDGHVKETLSHLYRRVPIFNTAFSYRNEALWRKKATNPNVEFKTFQNKPVEEVQDILRNYQYSEETGPLFCGILLKDCPDENIDPEDLNPDMEHSYYMFLGYHHGIGDGSSFNFINGCFVSILNDVIDDKPIGNEPLGTFIDGETEKLVAHATKVIKDDSKLKEKLSYESKLAECSTPCIALGLRAPGGERKIASLKKILDTNTTSTFLRKCKLENLSVNSAFTALVNAALVDIMIQNNYLKDTYVIQNVHVIDYRRYWSKHVPNSLGYHFRELKLLTSTTKMTEDQFWDYARSLHRTHRNDIESRRVVFEAAFQYMQSDGPLLTEEHLLSDKPCSFDFLLSNTGDITTLVTEGGEHVKVNHVLGGAAAPLFGNPMNIFILTFRGKFVMVFDYNVHYVDEIVVENLLSKILERIYSINAKYSSSKL